MKRRAFLGNAGFLPLQFVGVTTMNRLLRLTTLSVLLSGVTSLADASTISVPVTGSLSGFGDTGEQYRAQTFTGVGGLADEITFFVGPTFDASGVGFHLLITEVDTSAGIHPTNVLFESAPLLLPLFPIQFDPTPFTVALGGLPLSAGNTYAWMLDAFVASDGIFSEANTGIGTYAGGVMISQPLGPFPGGTRAEHFQSPWLVRPDLDLAFSLTVQDTTVPEPSTMTLLVIGLGSFISSRRCAAGRRRR